jgi:N-acetylglucosaminyldiphosphoundecaprenol N-acetyl-beta-D-mannosaminyltransferase
MQLVKSVEILGVRVDDATYADVMDRVDAFVATGRPHQIVTLNTEMVVAARDEPSFARALNSADLNVADSVGVVFAARLLGHRLRERVTGSDSIYRLAAHCMRQGYRPFFLGAAPGVAEVVAERLVAANPGLKVAGAYAGSPLPEDEDDIIARVRAVAPELLLVAYGVPAEEKWIARNRQLRFCCRRDPAGTALDATMGTGMALSPVPGTVALAAAVGSAEVHGVGGEAKNERRGTGLTNLRAGGEFNPDLSLGG